MVTNPNLWSGEYVQGVNTQTILSGDSVFAKLWRVEQSIKDVAIIKVFNYVSQLQATGLCDATRGASASSMLDLPVPQVSYSVVEKICKTDFNDTNYAMDMRAGVFNSEVPREVLEAYIQTLLSYEGSNIEAIRWIGDITSAVAPYSSQDGVITKMLANAGTIDVAPTAAGDSLDPATVLVEINKMLAATPTKVRTAKGFKILVAPGVAFAYSAALIAAGTYNSSVLLNQMYAGIAANDPNFVGLYGAERIPMYRINQLSNSNGVYTSDYMMLCGVFSDDISGNLVYTTDALTDAATIIVQDRQAVFANEPFIDVTWSFKQGMEVVRYNEVVLYN